MSRGERPDSAPPRIGGDEDDEHGAATKVGEWSAEVKAHLRAEGVLPESDRLEAARPSARPTPLPKIADPDEPGTDEVTKMYAELPAQEVVLADATPPPVPPRDRAVETPVAFTAPPPAQAPASLPLPARPREPETMDVRAFGGRSKTRMLIAMIVGMAALVGFAFFMAWMSQRR